MQFVKILRGDDELIHGIDHYLQDRCGRKLEQIIPYRDGNKIIFVAIFNDIDLSKNVELCFNKCRELSTLIHPHSDFHFFGNNFYHRYCCPAPWHQTDSNFLYARKEIGICGQCKKTIFGSHASCSHPSPDSLHELMFHALCCTFYPSGH